MKKPTLEQIAASLKKNGFKVFTTPFSVNLGGIRTADNESGAFNDWLYAFYYDAKGKLVGEVVEGTTDAGIYYRNNPLQKEGTAIIKHGVQHLGVYQLQDPAKDPKQVGHKGRKAFRQIKPMAYWRDGNKDDVLDTGGKTYIGIYYTNGHYMGTLGKRVDKWSAGCWGAVEKNMNKLFAIADMQIAKGLGDKFSFTLIHENDF